MIVNPHADVVIEKPWDFPVLIVDDFYLDVKTVREQAISADYSEAAAYYPGLHAPLRDADTNAVVHQLCGLLRHVGHLDIGPGSVRVDFSVITTPPEKLLAEQKHPHIDPVPLFGLVYLTPEVRTSTCFYRNRATGLHKLVTEADHSKQAEFQREFGTVLEPDGYDLGSSRWWDRIHALEGRYNRLVIYPGNVFHAVEPGSVPVPFDIRKARITQRFAFSEVRPAVTP